MATVTARKKKTGGTTYTAQIRTKVSGRVVSESATFDTRGKASAWAKRREVEIRDGKIHAKVKHTIRDLIEKYMKDVSQFKPLGRNKEATLKALRHYELCNQEIWTLSVQDFVEFARDRHKGGTGAATVGNDFAWLRVVWKAASPMWGIDVDLNVMENAVAQCRMLGLLGRPDRRQRIATEEEIDRICRQFLRNRSKIPMIDIVHFALVTGRRQAEITRLRWSDVDEGKMICLVTDVKHPTKKDGNDREFRLTHDALQIIHRQPRDDVYVFPYDPKTVGTMFRRAVRILEIQDLRFHDLRHTATTNFFKKGYSIQEVQQFTLHEDWNTLRRYTHLRAEDVVIR